MSSDFLSTVPTQPFESPDEPANEVYAATPPSTMAKLGASFEEGPASPTAHFSLSRWLGNSQYLDTAGGKMGRIFLQGMANETTVPGTAPADYLSIKAAQQLSPEEANDRYAPLGPDGKKQSITDKPLPEPVARSLGESRKAQIDREGIFQRYEKSHGWLVNRATDMGAMLDPLNAASMLVPGLGEEMFLGNLARIGITGIGARTLARIGAGSTAGAAGMVPVAALNYGLANSEGTDFGIRDFMSDLAMGAAFGAVIHGGLVGGYRELRYLRSGKAIGPGFPRPPGEAGEGGTVPPPEQPPGGGAPPGVSVEGEILPPEGANVPRETSPFQPSQVIENGPQTSFEEEVNKERIRLGQSYGAAQPSRSRLRDEARFSAFNREVGDRLDERLGSVGLTRTDAPDLHNFYDRRAGEHPHEALDRALDGWVDHEERAALQSHEYDSEWQHDMEVLRQHFESEAQGRSPEGMSRGRGIATYQAEGGRSRVGVSSVLPEGPRLGGSLYDEHFDVPFDSGVADANPVTKHAAIGAATSQLMEGRPVEVRPLFDEKATGSNTAQSQKQLTHNGYATGMPQAEFEATNAAVYPPEGAKREGTPSKEQGSAANGNRGRGGQGGTEVAGSGARTESTGEGHAPGGETERRTGEGTDASGAGSGAGATERGAEGKLQQLIPGVEPITDRERAELGMNKPLEGGNAKSPEGGLFDEDAKAQRDIFEQKLEQVDPDLALALRQLEGIELHPEDKAEIEAATAKVAEAEKQEDAFVQAATCLTEGGF